MEQRPDHDRHLDRVILLFLFAVFVLISPFKGIWAGPDSVWYAPYLLWAGLIVLSAWLQRRRKRHAL